MQKQPPAEGMENNTTRRRKKFVSSKAGGQYVHISTKSCNATRGNTVAAPEKQTEERKRDLWRAAK